MNETVNQEKNPAVEQQTERTFTQTELNTIVSDRLARERAKYADYNDLKAKAAQFDEAASASRADLEAANARAQDLQNQLDALNRANELRRIRERVAVETGVPANLLTGETEEDCTSQADAIRAYKMESPYPVIRDGGSPCFLGSPYGSDLKKSFSRDNKHTPKDKYSY